MQGGFCYIDQTRRRIPALRKEFGQHCAGGDIGRIEVHVDAHIKPCGQPIQIINGRSDIFNGLLIAHLRHRLLHEVAFDCKPERRDVGHKGFKIAQLQSFPENSIPHVLIKSLESDRQLQIDGVGLLR